MCPASFRVPIRDRASAQIDSSQAGGPVGDQAAENHGGAGRRDLPPVDPGPSGGPRNGGVHVPVVAQRERAASGGHDGPAGSVGPGPTHDQASGGDSQGPGVGPGHRIARLRLVLVDRQGTAVDRDGPPVDQGPVDESHIGLTARFDSRPLHSDPRTESQRAARNVHLVARSIGWPIRESSRLVGTAENDGAGAVHGERACIVEDVQDGIGLPPRERRSLQRKGAVERQARQVIQEAAVAGDAHGNTGCNGEAAA